MSNIDRSALIPFLVLMIVGGGLIIYKGCKGCRGKFYNTDIVGCVR